MSDDKGDNITEPVDEVTTTTATDPVSDEQAETSAQPQSEAPDGAEDEGNKLGGLMAEAEPPAETPAAKPAKPEVNLEAEAMRAAEQAVADGEKALASAREHLQQESAQQTVAAATAVAKPVPGSKNREFALRLLLAVNVMAMVVVALLPSPKAEEDVANPAVDPANVHAPATTPPAVARLNEPWNRALRASERRDFATAVAVLEQYLDDHPRMPESERLNVLSTLSNYASRNGDLKKSGKYTQQAKALEQSHYLPDDLVKMAEAALESGDQESLRRTWARFLLQQRQIPSYLYQHVAKAYLELGDSYRKDADTAAELARVEELTKAAAELRAEALKETGK